MKVTMTAPPPPYQTAPDRPAAKRKLPRWAWITTPSTPDTPATDQQSTPDSGTVDVYYSNCTAVRAGGKAPLYRGQPGYRAGLDRDNDGVACE
jgi:hypothetical protein